MLLAPLLPLDAASWNIDNLVRLTEVLSFLWIDGYSLHKLSYLASFGRVGHGLMADAFV